MELNGTVYAVFDGTDKVFKSDSASLNVDVALEATTNKDSGGWETNLQGVRSWSIDVSGIYDDSKPGTGNHITPAEILKKIIDRSAGTTMHFKPATGTASTGWSGAGLWQNINIEAPAEGVVKYSATIRSNGALTEIPIS